MHRYAVVRCCYPLKVPDTPSKILYYGDNLQILRERVASESVDLCYIDPPFNSQRNYNQIYSTAKRRDTAQTQAFMDTWTWDTPALLGMQAITSNEGGRFKAQTIELFRGFKSVLRDSSLLAYLVSMTLRLVEIHRVLKPAGSFYLHCDPTASHYLKIILDSLFDPGNYRSEIVWLRSRNPKGSQHRNLQWGGSTDTILFYAKSPTAKLHMDRAKSISSASELVQRFPNVDDRGRWDDGPILRSGSMGARPSLVYEYKGFTPGPSGWRVSRAKLEEIDLRGDLYWTTSNRPRRKLRPERKELNPLGNCWTDIAPINSQAQERLGYPTQKPESLMERIIKASSDEGDLVLDAYCGCGTTVAVAERLKRRWIGIDITFQSISLIFKRLEDSFGAEAMTSIHVDGIPRDLESAESLSLRKDDRTRKEFEKWAVLTYTNNRAVINQKKKADQGIDGVAFFATSRQDTEKLVLQAKSGNVQRADVATLNNDRQREGAELAILITLHEPTKPMREEAAKSGVYHHALMGRDMPRIQIVTVAELLAGKRMNLPLASDVLKAATRVGDGFDQQEIF